MGDVVVVGQFGRYYRDEAERELVLKNVTWGWGMVVVGLRKKSFVVVIFFVSVFVAAVVFSRVCSSFGPCASVCCYCPIVRPWFSSPCPQRWC